MHKTLTTSLAPFSTFSLASRASVLIRIDSVEELQQTITHFKKTNTSFIIAGAGSNTLYAPLISTPVIMLALKTILYRETAEHVFITAQAGALWDDVVLDTVDKGYSGLESLSAIPGTVGAAPIQNIGAYGVEVAEYIESILVYDIKDNRVLSLSPEECSFGYRTSNFKTLWLGRYVIVSVTLRVVKNAVPTIRYPGIEALIPAGQKVTPQLLRETIISVRWAKLPRPEVVPNLGSFFHNPVVSESVVERLLEIFPALPVFPSMSGMKKVSAGWLIEQCGWKGKNLGPVGMYENNALVMVNRGGATLADVLALQQAIERSVQERFGITLTREPRLVE
ncbi:MAG: UDP-N-acetylmuramate dehydrogenase [Minisyncoccia bacterium]